MINVQCALIKDMRKCYAHCVTCMLACIICRDIHLTIKLCENYVLLCVKYVADIFFSSKG